MTPATLTLPRKDIELLTEIGNYEIWKVPRKFGVKKKVSTFKIPDNLPTLRLKPAAEKRLLKIQKEALADYRVGKCRTFDSFIASEFPQLKK